MRDKPEVKLTEDEKLLVMAAALCGDPPEVVRGETHARANARRVLRQALFWGGLWNEQTRSALYKEDTDPVIEKWYRALIALCFPAEDGEPLMWGGGNLGDDGLPPSAPAYTGFGLTEAGWQCAKRLFRERPHLRDAEPPVDHMDLNRFYVDLDELPRLTCFSRISMTESEFQEFVQRHDLQRVYGSSDRGALPTSWPRCDKEWWNPPETFEGAHFNEHENGFRIAKYDNGYAFVVGVIGPAGEPPKGSQRFDDSPTI